MNFRSFVIAFAAIYGMTAGVALWAQQPQPLPVPNPQSPDVQAIAAKLMNEINVGLQCSSALITAQNKIAELEQKLAIASKPKE